MPPMKQNLWDTNNSFGTSGAFKSLPGSATGVT